VKDEEDNKEKSDEETEKRELKEITLMKYGN